MVGVFREVRRVLRADGTLFLNIGDSYNHSAGKRKPTDKAGPKQITNQGSVGVGSCHVESLKSKDLVGIPWMLAFALRADGWYLRSDLIWAKRNMLPESIEDRCSKSHEYVFMLTKSPRYFFDWWAVREQSTDPESKSGVRKRNPKAILATANEVNNHNTTRGLAKLDGQVYETRRPRSVWWLANHSYKGAHFATMPPRLAERCVRAGTSEKGCCPTCGAPWVRTLERKRVATRPGKDTKVTGDRTTDGNRDPGRHCTAVRHVGWEPGCGHGLSPVGCLVLDPFLGAGTTGLVCERLNRRWLGLELNGDYAAMAEARIAKANVGLGLVV